MEAANRPLGWCPGRGQNLCKASFASFTPLRTNSPALEKKINGIGRHKILVRKAEGVGSRLDRMPFQVPPHLEILGFCWDGI